MRQLWDNIIWGSLAAVEKGSEPSSEPRATAADPPEISSFNSLAPSLLPTPLGVVVQKVLSEPSESLSAQIESIPEQ